MAGPHVPTDEKTIYRHIDQNDRWLYQRPLRFQETSFLLGGRVP